MHKGEKRMRFSEKVVIVTGAGSGIGAGAAKRFLREGAKVTLAGRTLDKLEETAKEFSTDQYLLSMTDVSDEGQVDKMIQDTVKKFGQLDVIVNNAGIAVSGKITEITSEQWRRQMVTNVDGVFYGCKFALPHLMKTKGCIINISSVSGLGGDDGMAAYNASKGAISNLTRSLAIDHGPDGIRVNAVCPSFTITGMTEDMMDDQNLMEAFTGRMPLGRPAQPDDIAGVIAFLASDDARFVTGVNLPVDGGVMASNGQPIYYE